MNYFFRALKIYEKEFGEESLEIVNTYENIGYAYYYKNEYEEGLKYFNKVLKIRENNFGGDNVETAISYHNIGTLYSD